MKSQITTLANTLFKLPTCATRTAAFRLAWRIYKLLQALKNNWVYLTFQKLNEEPTTRCIEPDAIDLSKLGSSLVFRQSNGEYRSFRLENLLSWEVA